MMSGLYQLLKSIRKKQVKKGLEKFFGQVIIDYNYTEHNLGTIIFESKDNLK